MGVFATVRDLCVECGECTEVCNAEAREIAGRDMSNTEVQKEIGKDVIFYEHSGGGASFSGGEPLLQHEFLLALLKACAEKIIPFWKGKTIRQCLASLDFSEDPAAYGKREELKAMSVSIDAVLTLASRYAGTVHELAEKETDPGLDRAGCRLQRLFL